MVDAAILPALREALRRNAPGGMACYALSYAGPGRSGARFGLFRHDTSLDANACSTLWAALRARQVPEDTIARIVDEVSGPGPDRDGLSPDDASLVDAALGSPAGRSLVDQMDGRILAVIVGEMDNAIAAARASQKRIDPEAQIAIGLWVSMTGAPIALNAWLGGDAIDPATPRGDVVTRADVAAYLKRTHYFTLHPGSLVRFNASVDAGARLISESDESCADVSSGGYDPASGLGGGYWVYAQRTGRVFHVESGEPTLLAESDAGSGVPASDLDDLRQRGQGPLPRGRYTLGAPSRFDDMHDCLPLYPDPENDMHGETGFSIHDAAGPVGSRRAMTGGISLRRPARLAMWQSNDHILEVVRDDP